MKPFLWAASTFVAGITAFFVVVLAGVYFGGQTSWVQSAWLWLNTAVLVGLSALLLFGLTNGMIDVIAKPVQT